MKRCSIIVFVIFSLLMIGCGTKKDKVVESATEESLVPKSRILFHHPTIYSSLLFTNNPTVAVLTSTDYTNGAVRNQSVFQKNWGKNTIMFDSIAPYYVTQTDSFEIVPLSNYLSPNIVIHHQSDFISCRQKKNGSNGDATARIDTIVDLNEDIVPIEITQPVFDECNVIPYCWYHNMDIAWNADPNNLNGVVIIAAWTGVKLRGHTDSNMPPIYNVDLVEDNGYTTLDDDLFQGMPENAVVTLILLRANVVNVEIEGETYFLDPGSYDTNSDGISEFIANFLYTREEKLSRSYTLALGTEAHFSFVLIRDSYQ